MVVVVMAVELTAPPFPEVAMSSSFRHERRQAAAHAPPSKTDDGVPPDVFHLRA